MTRNALLARGAVYLSLFAAQSVRTIPALEDERAMHLDLSAFLAA